MALELQPITFPEAEEFIRIHHRHHLPPQGWKFGIAANDGEKVVAVVAVGRPVARHADDGLTLELTRVCSDGTKNACSFLLGAARRASWALGFKRLITYTLPSEGGISLRAAGYRTVGTTPGKTWNYKGRPRVDKHPLGQKLIWEA